VRLELAGGRVDEIVGGELLGSPEDAVAEAERGEHVFRVAPELLDERRVDAPGIGEGELERLLELRGSRGHV